MLKPQIQHSRSLPSIFRSRKPFFHGTVSIPVLSLAPAAAFPKTRKNGRVGSGCFVAGSIKAIATTEKSISVKAVVTVKPTVRDIFSSIEDSLGKTLMIELISSVTDEKTGLEKETIKGYAHQKSVEEGNVKYEGDFQVPEDFGEIGAVFVENEHHKEMYLEVIVLDGFMNGPINVTCNSWVHSKFDNHEKRVFFSHKSYLPVKTPNGLKRIRNEELVILQGNGQGQRKTYERIYDYDVYNDFGNPDSSDDLKRPVLGGKDHPYPRRCRTGRPRCERDSLSEKRCSCNYTNPLLEQPISLIYVPRDEVFSEINELSFLAKTLHRVLPSLEIATVDTELGFPYFTAIDSLFNEGGYSPRLTKPGILSKILGVCVKAIDVVRGRLLKFKTPATMEKDKFFWFRDEEFGRQTLAGLNPYSIELVTEWPLKSALDPKIYGPQESAITSHILEPEIRGYTTVEEAIKQKKLFMLDYHDLLMPYVKNVREIKGHMLYGSRTIFFLTPDCILKPLAIELTRPPMDGKPQWKEVYTPGAHSTACWLWRLAKAHVLAHDSGYHQLVSHWLRTHACTEPYIIATNRQLSAMHPIYRLLHPHFRYTMEINALAREVLINAGGIIESTFSPGKYSLEISFVAYDLQWRFDHQALPADLISSGMAVADPTAPHGLKLTVQDYPFANDGLVLWDCIKQWVTDYVTHYYADSNSVVSDQEIQSWWTEIRTVGHGDKKDEPWWSELKTTNDLIEILTTIIWVTSGHHAAVNFGQYPYAGYFPNRPTVARRKMPTEDATAEEWALFLSKPEMTLLLTYPSQIQAMKVMAVLDALSMHSPDEEYLGEKIEPAWAEEPMVKAAFERFNGRLKELDGVVDERNADTSLKNRNGAGVMPYELLKPFSKSGVTTKGVPYSISI